ncbi:MAG: phosphonate C-P lyase system protein PhnG, partial [Rhizobiales bacterium]|nr:phosphonate C-P lyase system protein PhnG [Hyphomicrobiales bacterium]
ARLVALCDALIQAPSYAGAVRDAVIEPLRRARDAERQRTREQAAATRVDFFTLVRGED